MNIFNLFQVPLNSFENDKRFEIKIFAFLLLRNCSVETHYQ